MAVIGDSGNSPIWWPRALLDPRTESVMVTVLRRSVVVLGSRHIEGIGFEGGTQLRAGRLVRGFGGGFFHSDLEESNVRKPHESPSSFFFEEEQGLSSEKKGKASIRNPNVVRLGPPAPTNRLLSVTFLRTTTKQSPPSALSTVSTLLFHSSFQHISCLLLNHQMVRMCTPPCTSRAATSCGGDRRAR